MEDRSGRVKTIVFGTARFAEGGRQVQKVNLVLVGEAWGEAEARLGCAFVGPSGAALLSMLSESGLLRFTAADRDFLRRYYQTQDSLLIDAIWQLHPEIFRTNVFNIHPARNDLSNLCADKSLSLPGFGKLGEGWIHAQYHPELNRLAADLLHHNPNLIVCLGNVALWALTGKIGISKLRGTTLLSTHTVSGFKLLPTYHPAAILRQWEQRPTVIADLMKAAAEAEYPEIRRPEREIWIEPSLADIERFFSTYCRRENLLSVDIETSGTRITCIGFAPSASIGIVIPFDDERSTSGSYWQNPSDELAAWRLIRDVLEDSRRRKLFHNGLYDITFLYRSMKIKVQGAEEDTMLLHHALQPESLKGLGYLGSVYLNERAWKNMRTKETTIKRDA